MSKKDFITFSEEEAECILAVLSISKISSMPIFSTIKEVKRKILQEMLDPDKQKTGIPFLGVCK